MTSMLQRENDPLKGRNLILVVSVIQIALVLAILFLPLFGTCIGSEPCSYQSYIQMGGNIVGFGFLGGLIVLGGLLIVTSYTGDIGRTRLLLGVNIVVNVLFAIVGAWSFGLAFLPVALMLLLALRSMHR
jgi:hypothetical protein